ncbi:MAG: valine--tRNA ligase [Bacilli bacterium]|nr:valine--tRNA ligase [Bacilli bacterium]
MLDKKYDFKEKEKKWMNYWKDNNIYEFKNDEREIYSIDTPPPTVNGKIHMGHIFSYTQTEMIARYKRLRGYNVFYPFGFDDNGLPSERLVEKECGKKAHEIGRETFSKLCYETTNKYEDEFKQLFYKLGLSADLEHSYKTVSPSTMKISQRSFIELVNKGDCYRKNSPALWCNECLTSVAQAELETKTLKTIFNYIKFKTDDDEFIIATTRPELLPAIVCVFVNPNDEKNKHLIGKKAYIPLINIGVPIMGDDKVDADKGTGIVMCCTFGDQTDIEWWKKYNLSLKKIFTNDGKIIDSIENYGGLKIKEARYKIIEDLKNGGYLVKQEELEHEVMVHERCGKEIEYSVIPQWFINIMDHKKDFLEYGNKINWFPSYMKSRYDNWVENLLWDWCISRQRYFGIPFPVWYCKDCGKEMVADINDLPVNPLTDKPKHACSCGCNDFIPDKDIMDTWATSSLTPLINMKYGEKDNLEKELKIMSLRANAHDNIRVWDFYTIVKSFYHFKEIPWKDVMISGFIMAGKGEKLSKSKSNTKSDPISLIDNYSADVVRYYGGIGRLGLDAIYDEAMFDRGRKLINKLWNVSKFIEMHLSDYQDKKIDCFEYIDRWIIGKYQDMEKQFLKYLDEYEVGLALNTLEKFFWNFCDNYIEIVKHRLYRPEEFGEISRYSGQKTIYMLLYKLLQDFSIYFPFITEEIYQELYHDKKSIHLTQIYELNYEFNNEKNTGDKIVAIISEVRGYKSSHNVSLKTIIKKLDISVNNELESAIKESMEDLCATLFIDNLIMHYSDEEYQINYIEMQD